MVGLAVIVRRPVYGWRVAMDSAWYAWRKLAMAVLCTGLWALACAAAVGADQKDKTPARVPIATMETKIVPGCILEIMVDGEDEISRTYTVDEKGSVRFAITDSAGVNREQWSVVLTGKNTAEARAVLAESFSRYYKNPEVHVKIVRIPGLHVEIMGEVVRAGVYVLPFNSRMSDLFGIAMTKPMADLTNILFRRIDPKAKTAGEVVSFSVDFTSGAAADDSDDPKLEDGDKIYLRKMAEAPISIELQFVRVVGEINNTGRTVVNGVVQREDGVAIPIGKEMKLKDVFEQIGGLKDSADRTHIYLGRLDGTTRVLNADKIQADDADDNVKLKAGDLVIVPTRDRSQVFAVLGEVNAPNTFALRQGEKVRVLQAIQRAGDFSKKADHHRAILSKGYLLDPTKARAIPFDPDLVKKGEQPNMELDPGDAVIIEQRKKRPTIWQQLLPFALHFLPI